MKCYCNTHDIHWHDSVHIQQAFPSSKLSALESHQDSRWTYISATYVSGSYSKTYLASEPERFASLLPAVQHLDLTTLVHT